MYNLEINLIHHQYPIYIQNGLFENIGIEMKKRYSKKKITILTDYHVEKIYGENLKNNLLKNDFLVKVISIPPGEKSKSIDTLMSIYENLLDFQMTRDDVMIILGGGVVGDVGGFAAATFLRGISFIQIPTSLLAQIDSSIGGKVAVNLERGKNLIGSFYHPEAVFIDPEVLKTLDPRFFNDGMAEVIKYACIKDKTLFYDLLEGTQQDLYKNLESIIYKCCTIKKEIVQRDEKDHGERMLLNFGHTIGHAIEKYFDYTTYTHGEGVAMGMAHITKRSEELGITKMGTFGELVKVLKKYDLPFEMPLMEKENMIKHIGVDKKRKEKSIYIILLKEIGESFIQNIKEEEMHAYL
ncbi:3-dehydroquinate synthase [Inediibacterium massiliense]|uniref:3-dehydroquinate synthase n=1 Tax=Inediibacterium massiliense TaxID=1658111 RepID=UPI0006B6434C|nr:3-dehydroquinate synthase [Inediibacterium massiliense]